MPNDQITPPISCKIVRRSIKDLKFPARNPRKYGPAHIDRLATSIKTFKYVGIVVVDKDLEVVAGRARLLACQRLGITEVDTVQLEHLTKAQAKAFSIADNRLAENVTWDERLLRDLFRIIHSGSGLYSRCHRVLP